MQKNRIDEKYAKLRKDVDKDFDTKLSRMRNDIKSKIEMEKSNYSKKLADLEDS